jgi:hypothetical protein
MSARRIVLVAAVLSVVYTAVLLIGTSGDPAPPTRTVVRTIAASPTPTPPAAAARRLPPGQLPAREISKQNRTSAQQRELEEVAVRERPLLQHCPLRRRGSGWRSRVWPRMAR